jgi:Flp pilus assembly protein TadB
VTIVGALAAGAMVALAIVASLPRSSVERRLRSFRAAPQAPRALAERADHVLVARIGGALAAGLAACILATIASLGVIPVAAGAYAGWIAPSLVADRRRARRRTEAERAIVTLVEWLHALVSSGRPLETALVTAAGRTRGTTLLDGVLARTTRDYTLGVPLHRALLRHATDDGIDGLIELAGRLDRARDLGRGALPLLADLREELRARERARALAAASAVEGNLTAVLTLCYLPALALLVIVPLFLTLLAGLLG